jgi:NitT/TauT family transport system substrate-binding protein
MTTDKAGEGQTSRRQALKLIGIGAVAGALGSPWLRAQERKKKILFSAKAAGAQRGALSTAAFYIAHQLGYYEDEGVKQEVVDFQAGGDQVRAITTGTVHWGTVSTPAAAIAFLKGSPIRIIGGGVSTTMVYWIVLKDSPIQKLSDLRGKKIGYSRPGSTTHVFGLHLIDRAEKEGVNPHDISMVSIGEIPQAYTSLRTGIVDVSYSSYPHLAKQLAEGTVRVLAEADDFVQQWLQLAIVTRDDFAREHPDALRAVLRAYHRANELILKEPETAARALSEALDRTMPVDVLLAGLKKTPSRAFSLRIGRESLEEIERALLRVKLIDRKIPWSELVDQSFLPQDMRTRIT